ncbi:MAG: DUF4968 domain-containing protein [Chitinophagaceae bacterium]|nr:DUF4968 domain-containing protein [Chitinophagaceae bacterium]
MKNRILLLLCLIPFTLVSVAQLQTPGNCNSYTVNGNTVVFNGERNARVSIKICSPSVLKIWFSADGQFKRNNESFAVIREDLEQAAPVQVNDEPQAYEIFTSRLRIRVNKSPFRLQVFDKWQKLLLSDHNEKGLLQDSNTVAAFKQLRSDEQFFGLGEKSGPVNRRGRTYTMWNSDKPCYGPQEDPLYKSIPFFFSNYKYGIFFDNTWKSKFDFGAASSEYFSFSSNGGEMVYYFIHGNDYAQIIEQYTQLTGKPIMPPNWAFGFSQCRGLYTNEKLARTVAAEFRKRKIPCDIIYQDIGWTEGLQNFKWAPDRYSDPKGMLKYLDSLGFKMIVSQDPVISQKTAEQWKEADAKGYFTTDIRTGRSYDMPWPWGGNCGVVDFTNPEVADWWGEYQQKPLSDGVRGFWTDMGEPAWSNEDATDRLFMKHHAGMHGEIHNVYGLTWDKVVKEQFEKHNPGKRVFQMTRAAYAGLQRYTFGWSGDAGNGENVMEGWGRLSNQVAVGVSAGMGLIPFWSCDISGYCGDIKDYPAMAELYTRWMQFGVFNPLSRAHHEGDNAVEPWLFGAEAEKNCRAAIEMKYRLFPYIYSYARQAHDKGLPIMRAMILEFPEEENAATADDQFMFGKEMLVAPVVKKGAVSRKIWLPEGEWIDFNDGKTVYEGGQTITYKAPLSVIPVLVKKGSIIPQMPVMQFIGEKKDHPVELHVYPASHTEPVPFELYEDDGESLGYLEDRFCKTKFECRTEGKKYRLSVAARNSNGFQPSLKRKLVWHIHLAKKPVKVLLDKKALTTGMSWDAARNVFSITIPDNGQAHTIELINN